MRFLVSAFTKETTAPATTFPSGSVRTPCTNACCEKAGSADITRANNVRTKGFKGKDIKNYLKMRISLGTLQDTTFIDGRQQRKATGLTTCRCFIGCRAPFPFLRYRDGDEPDGKRLQYVKIHAASLQHPKRLLPRR